MCSLNNAFQRSEHTTEDSDFPIKTNSDFEDKVEHSTFFINQKQWHTARQTLLVNPISIAELKENWQGLEVFE